MLLSIILSCMALLTLGLIGYYLVIAFVTQKAFGVFLCHHKDGGAVLARWFKLQLAGEMMDTVFLDSDALDRLDMIVDTVSHDTKNLVVLLTKETLRRPWCAAEVTGGVRYKVNSIHIHGNYL